MSKKSISGLFCIAIFLVTLCSCSSNQSNGEYAAKINKHWIKSTDYMLILQKEYESFHLQYNASPSSLEQKKIEERAWNKLIEGYVLKDIFEKFHIVVNQNELADTLLNNIPEMVKKSIKLCQSDGTFDVSLYESSLKTGKPVNLNWLKQYYYSSYIPMAKLKKHIMNTRKIDESEVKNYFLAKNSTAELSIINFPNKDYYDKVVISPSEIEEYYKDNITTYEIPATCHLKWVKFPIRPDQSDSLLAKSIADSLYNELLKGSSFSSLASKYSDGPYGPKKGYAGFMDIQTFPNELGDRLKNAKDNEILEPYFMNGSYYILSPTEKTVSMVKLMVLQIDIKATKNTTDRIKDRIKKFRELAKSIGFDNATSEYRYKLFSQDSLSINKTWLQDLGVSESVVSRALNTPAGVIFDPIEHDKSNSMVVFYVERSTRRSFKKVDSVSGDIIDILKDRKAKLIANEDAQLYLKKYGNKVLSQAKTDNKSCEDISRFDFHSKINGEYTLDINKKILDPNTDSHLVFLRSSGAFICIINATFKPDMVGFLSQKEALKSELQRLNLDSYFDEFMKSEKEKAKIKDLRFNK